MDNLIRISERRELKYQAKDIKVLFDQTTRKYRLQVSGSMGKTWAKYMAGDTESLTDAELEQLELITKVLEEYVLGDKEN